MTGPQPFSRPKPSGGSGHTGIRPKDAATLILVDARHGEPRFLLGRRRRDLVFMPGKYVFPGGRCDRADARAPECDAVPDALAHRVLKKMNGRPSLKRARALPVTALRETREETGIELTDPARLTLAARAITPPGPPRRYDTRFFITDASETSLPRDLSEAGDGELEDLSWHTFGAVDRLDIPHITRIVLSDIAERLAGDDPFDHARPVPHYFFRYGTFYRELL